MLRRLLLVLSAELIYKTVLNAFLVRCKGGEAEYPTLKKAGLEATTKILLVVRLDFRNR